MTKRLYVAATNQHVGKTTTTLGLVEAFRQKGIRVGYCKPVGQETVSLNDLQVDKDALLFSTMMSFDLIARIHSPVILGKGATQAFLDAPEKFQFKEDIERASAILEKEYEMVIYEGTGHPGVGSVVGLSNADVAKMLEAQVVLIVEGGIGYTIDRLYLCLSPFVQMGVPVAGVIINKVLPEKMEKVRHYVGMKLKEWGIPLLGVMPYDKTLLYPLLGTICRSIKGKVLYHPEGLGNIVENVVAASLLGSHNFDEDKGVLLVVSQNRANKSIGWIRRIHAEKGYDQMPLVGVIITGDGKNEVTLKDFEHMEFIDKYGIPMIATPLDTYGTAVKISHMEVKINVQSLGKAHRAVELVNEHVDLDKIEIGQRGNQNG
ncbi:MAG TPA: hypothetical protein ENJ95_11145 [Bacteroidetes bacterium]|nr:hypothetical protein [Bacteroidota bacterium]